MTKAVTGLENTDLWGRICRFLHTARCIFVYENGLPFPPKSNGALCLRRNLQHKLD